MKNFYTILSAALTMLVCGCVIGYHMGKRRYDVPAQTVTETKVEYKVIYRDAPQPVSVTSLGERLCLLPVHDTTMMVVHDTVTVYLPFEQKEYGSDSTYRAWVSGYRPQLDSIRIYQRSIIETNTIIRKEQPRWGLGIQAGGGVAFHDGGIRISPYIGVGVSYNLLVW